MNTPIDRRAFLRHAAAGSALAACCPLRAATAPVAPPNPDDAQTAATIQDWLTPIIQREEKTMDRAALLTLLHERGRLCCRRLEFRRKLVEESAGDVDKLVVLMGRIVGPENCTREGDTIRLVYPFTNATELCGCGANPKRDPSPDDPYCECSRANNQRLFEIVSGRKVEVALTESRRRGGKRCIFGITLT